MELSRKRKRELKKLRKQTEDLLQHQREVLGHAGDVLGAAGRQAKHLSDEHIAPRAQGVVNAVRPVVDRGAAAGRRAANRARMIAAPVLATALAGTISSLERMESRDTAKQLRKFGEERGIIEVPKRRRFGKFVAITAGIAAASAVGYALWQAFREDEDDMWVSTDEV